MSGVEGGTDALRDGAGESPERVLDEIRSASEAFGAAREGTHLAAYAQERVIRKVTWLLAEGRWALAGLADAWALVDAIRLESYRLSPAERKAIEDAIRAADASVSNHRIAKMLGVHHDTVDRDFGGNPPPGRENDNESKDAEKARWRKCAPGLSGVEAADLLTGATLGSAGEKTPTARARRRLCRRASSRRS